MFDPVPWFVGGGAQHSPEVARLLAYSALGGAEGITTPGDLKVLSRAVPGAGVRVVVGSAAILSRAAGGGQQTYLARNPTEEPLNIAATTSAGGRSDLIVIRVEDPFMAGEPWAAPTNPLVGPYVFARVISNVPSTTTSVAQLNLGYSAIELARIDIPSSTATITQAMVTDLRKLARPRQLRMVEMNGPTAEIALTSANGMYWPSFRPTVAIPTWATHVAMVTTLSSIGQRGGDATGVFTATIGAPGATQFRATNVPYDVDQLASGSVGQRHTLICGGAGALNTALRGTSQVLGVEGRLDVGPGYLITVQGSHVIFDLEFFERAV